MAFTRVKFTKTKGSYHRYLAALISLMICIGILSAVWAGYRIWKTSGKVATTNFKGSERIDQVPINTQKRKRDVVPEKIPTFRVLPRSTIEFFQSGVISDDAANLLELSESERILIQEVVNKHFGDLRAAMAATVETSESNSTTSFFIPALKDRGRNKIEEFQNDLAAILREERAKKVMVAMPVTHYFGGLGQFDTHIDVISRLNYPPEIRPDSDWVKIKYVNPDTGQVMTRRSTSWNLGSQWFPGLFETQSN